MQSKKCPRCKRKRRAKFFAQNYTKGTLQSYCKDCQRAAYYDNAAVIKKRSYKNNQIRIIQNKEKLIELLRNSECKDCGEWDIVVLEFDHVKHNKTKNISKMISQSYCWESILAEIAKCEVVCANCHRRRTYKQFGSYRTD